MNRAERGREQLENAITKLQPKGIDLTVFMDEEQIHRIKNAGEYRDKLIDLIENNGEKGDPLPWNALEKKFEFRPSEITVWSGYKGHGKSLLISQFLENMVAKNKKVFIISPEFPPHRVLHRMMIQEFGMEHTKSSVADQWLEIVKENLWIYDQQGSLKAKDVPALCRYAIKHFNVDHILIDSLMKLGISVDDYTGQKTLVDEVQHVAHHSKTHIHIVAHGNKSNGGDEKIGNLHSVKGASEICDLAENVLIVWRNKEKEFKNIIDSEMPDCILKVEAQRNGDGWIGQIPLFFNKATLSFKG